MSKIVRWVASATLGLLVGSLLLTSAAQAQDKTPEPEWFGVNYVESHEWEPELSVELTNCTFTVQANSIPYHVSSGTRTAGLAIQVNGVTVAYTEPKTMDNRTGSEFYEFEESLSSGPVVDGDVVEFRWFAGPDRDDLPAWNLDHLELNEIIDEVEQKDENNVPTNRHWNAGDDAEFVNWYAYDGEVTGCTPPSESLSPEASKSPEADDSCELIERLDVAEERRDGYDRDLFGDYDRQALLDASFAEHGDYYSMWDNTHYTDASDVDVDHTVALAEAWDSGAHSWTPQQRDAFAGDPINLTLLTDEVNRGLKSDGDFVEWVPSVSELLDEYLLAYVNVKATYNLSVDETEREELLDAAIELGLCDYDESPAPSTGGPDDAADLPVTGSSLPVIIGIGAGLLGVGVGLFFLARRRRGRYHFTA